MGIGEKVIRFFLHLKPQLPMMGTSTSGGAYPDWAGLAEQAREKNFERIQAIGARGKKKDPDKPIIRATPDQTVEYYLHEFAKLKTARPRKEKADRESRKEREQVWSQLSSLYRSALKDEYIVARLPETAAEAARPNDLYAPGPNDPAGRVLRAWREAAARLQQMP